jgi:hypothetical protein
MRSIILILVTLLYSAPLMAQGAEAGLQSELETLHAKWFKAFDSGDGAAMDLMEMDKLVLVMPTGFIWTKTVPRGGAQKKHDAQIERTLTDVTVRHFGDAAILTGILATNQTRRTIRRRRQSYSYRVLASGRLRQHSGAPSEVPSRTSSSAVAQLRPGWSGLW